MPISPDATEVLNREFLEVRARLLEVGAALDRIDRASGSTADDPRREQIRGAISELNGSGPDRVERIQLLFSLPYQSDWKQQFALGDLR